MDKLIFRGSLAAGFLLALLMLVYNANTANRLRAKAADLGVQSVELNLDRID